MEEKPNIDPNLIEAFKKGDEGAFRQVYAFHYRQLYYFARKMTNSADDAKDIVSETFMKLWTRCGSFETLTNIKAFLFITARNACINRIKFEKSEKEKERLYARSAGEEMAYIFELMASHDLLQEVEKELNKLSENERKIVELFYLQGNSLKQIAERLNIEYEAAKKAKFRALARLRSILNEKKPPLVVGSVLLFVVAPVLLFF